MHIVGYKSVFKPKLAVDGSLSHLKAKLVSKGFHQVKRLDYFDTFSPVVRPTTIKLVISLVTTLHWPVQQYDGFNAFLHGYLDTLVYMEQSPSFLDPLNPSSVCSFHRALYCLK